jgi:hypothetical protein
VPRKVFVAGEILTAADVNTNLMDQAVMSFAGTAARGSAIPSPVEGMATYIADQDLVQLYDGAAWKNSLGVTGGILQVVSAVKTDTFTSTSSTYVDVTGLSATITPSSASSKILVFAQISLGHAQTGTSGSTWRMTGGGIGAYVGDASASINREIGGFTDPSLGWGNGMRATQAGIYLDSPATTSATTYQAQVARFTGGTVYVNRGSNDSGRGASSITLMEVAA